MLSLQGNTVSSTGSKDGGCYLRQVVPNRVGWASPIMDDAAARKQQTRKFYAWSSTSKTRTSSQPFGQNGSRKALKRDQLGKVGQTGGSWCKACQCNHIWSGCEEGCLTVTPKIQWVDIQVFWTMVNIPIREPVYVPFSRRSNFLNNSTLWN